VGKSLVFILAAACGISVATIYFPQAITPLIAAGFARPAADAALAVTAAQLGYAAGLFLLVPLGDRVRHRPLVVTLLTLTAIALFAASQAPTLPFLIGASAVAGFTTVVPQILLPMGAGLAAPERRGAVTGTLLAGLLAGILLARAFSGTLGELLGWRAPYEAGAILIVALAAILAIAIPKTVPTSAQHYPALIGAAFALWRDEPELRRSCFYQALTFGSFSAAWTALALFLHGPTYGLGGQAVGLIALVGAGSVFATPIAGRKVDRWGSDTVNLVCFFGMIAAVPILAAGLHGGPVGLGALAAGMLILDVAIQCGQVANQSRIFAVRPAARSRLNTAYMTCAFLGGSAGSWISVEAYTRWGWGGVCALITGAAGIALARHLARRRRRAPA
jgi:predicted MFS family arabinose efflux permease